MKGVNAAMLKHHFKLSSKENSIKVGQKVKKMILLLLLE
jgi:hypothetical protein